jgi:hypothetical protein
MQQGFDEWNQHCEFHRANFGGPTGQRYGSEWQSSSCTGIVSSGTSSAIRDHPGRDIDHNSIAAAVVERIGCAG